MNGYICIHGHFYQPPRENPWIDRIELQESAVPFHDWNVRVSAECYGPNAFARILDSNGKIVRIVNNYERINFNFGPSLLGWMSRYRPDVLRRIIEADELSGKRFSGHGNAMAQAYSHMIMPLANRRDKLTQIIWGIKDFEHHFNRRPEGMWLPELAVDLETLEFLHEQGLNYTILSPGQARRSRPLDTVAWQEHSSGRAIDASMPYLVKLPSGGEIAIFFYDGAIAHDIAFGDLLTSGSSLATRLLASLPAGRKTPPLVNIAVDGETFGHHHHFGDMALAYALEQIEGIPDVQLTNYGEYLARHPPTHEVEIHPNSSWSCPHGIERWRSDCGCRTGGNASWRQGWRAPLRESLDWLRHDLVRIFSRHACTLLKDPWLARDDYIEVRRTPSERAKKTFLERHAARPLAPGEQQLVLELLEMQHAAMLMYTSCGWFFEEISGLEPVQILRYADRAIALAEKISGAKLEDRFLVRLAAAQSNIAEMGNGADIFHRLVTPGRVDLPAVAAHFAMSLFFTEHLVQTELGCFRIRIMDQARVQRTDTGLIVGRLTIESAWTMEVKEFLFVVYYEQQYNYMGAVKPISEEPSADKSSYKRIMAEIIAGFDREGLAAVAPSIDACWGSSRFTIRDLFRNEQQVLLDRIVTDELDSVEQTFGQVFRRISALMGILQDLRLNVPPSFTKVADIALKREILKLAEDLPVQEEKVVALLAQTRKWQINLDDRALAAALQQKLDAEMRRVQEGCEVCNLHRAISLMAVIALFPGKVNLWTAQNTFYELVLTVYPAKDSAARVAKDKEWFRAFLRLGEALQINVEETLRLAETPAP